MNDKVNEHDSAWELLNRLEELSTLLWNRYEFEFMERCLEKIDEQQRIESDAFDEPQPF